MAELFLALLLGSVSTWRLSYMLQNEVGPLAAFDKLRRRVDRLPMTDGGVREMYYCMACLSVWAAIVLMIIFVVAPYLFWVIGSILFASTVAMTLNSYAEKIGW